MVQFSPQMTKLQDIPPEVRKRVTEYLQPPSRDQTRLEVEYQLMAANRNQLRAMERHPMLYDTFEANLARRALEQSKSNYHAHLERVTKAPGIYETYRHFWDDSRPFPDQGPGGGGYGGGPFKLLLWAMFNIHKSCHANAKPSRNASALQS